MDWKLYAEMAQKTASFEEVADVFALTPEQKKSPNAGRIIVEHIRQLQTAYTLRMQVGQKEAFERVEEK